MIVTFSNQECNFNFSSYGHGLDEMVLNMNLSKWMVFAGANLDYKPELVNKGCGQRVYPKLQANVTVCQITIVLNRMIWKYFVEKIAPSTLIVMVSWVSFFICQ